VIEGGSLDLDVTLIGPDGGSLFSKERRSEGKYNFAPYLDGVYKFCFSTATAKTVMFDFGSLNREQDGTKYHEKQVVKEHNQLEAMVEQLSLGLTSVKEEQKYMEVRGRIHRAINDNTNSSNKNVLLVLLEEIHLLACDILDTIFKILILILICQIVKYMHNLINIEMKVINVDQFYHIYQLRMNQL